MKNRCPGLTRLIASCVENSGVRSAPNSSKLTMGHRSLQREPSAPTKARKKSTHPRSAPTVEKIFFWSGLGPFFGPQEKTQIN